MDSFNYSLQRKAFHSFLLSNRDLIKVAIDSSQSMIGFVIASFSVPQRAKINALFVLPSYQRNGVGSLLLNALYDELRSYPKLVYLSVRIPVVYGKSKLFFLSNQFKTITRINNYYSTNLDFQFIENRDVEIRKAEKRDFKGLLQIEKACFSDFWQMDKRKFENIMRTPNYVLFVALLNGEIVGYNFNLIRLAQREGNYVRIATIPEYRRKGIATKLTAHAFKWFREHRAGRILLSTYAHSEFHNKMYRKWGFKIIDQEEIMAKQYSYNLKNK